MNLRKRVYMQMLIATMLSLTTYGQTLYVPSSTGGIGTSSNGNVGIGTASPDHLFLIHNSNNPTLGIGKPNQNTNGLSSLAFSAGNATQQNSFFVRYFKDATADRLAFIGGGGTENLTVLNNGRVGIGTNAPRGKFDVNGVGSGSIYLTDDPNAGSSQSLFLPGHIFLSPYSGGNVSYFQARRPDNSGTMAIQFRTTSAGSLVESMFIGGNGNIGMGTTIPQASVEIKRPDASVYITASNATGSGIGNPSLYINRMSEGLKLEYVPNVLARISNTYVGPSGHLAFATAGQDRLFITGNGDIGIGTTDPKGYKLAVAGKAIAEEVVVKLQSNWPDYVFEKDYNLPTLAEVENYINQNKHLPEVPAAKEMEKNGVNLGEMNMLLLKKVEELTLYVLEQHKTSQIQSNEIKLLKQQLRALELK
jgi:hypothetical protein